MLRSNEMTIVVMNEKHFLLFYNYEISKRLFTILPELFKIALIIFVQKLQISIIKPKKG